MPSDVEQGRDLNTRALKRLRPFVRIDRALISDPFFSSWTKYSSAYNEAVRAMAIATKNAPLQLELRIPFLYLARHAMELSLKDAITFYIGMFHYEHDAPGHNLVALWDKLVKLIDYAGYATDDDWTAYCGKLIRHLHEWDPGGERFRYPTSRQGIEFAPTEVDVDGVVNACGEVNTYCLTVIGMLQQEISDFLERE